VKATGVVAQVEVPAVRVAAQGAVMAAVEEGEAEAVQAAVQGAVMAAVEEEWSVPSLAVAD
jgi:hypothetical protein